MVTCHWCIAKRLRQIRELGSQCFYCGLKLPDYILQFSHIRETGLKGMGRGLKQRYYDRKNNSDAYILTCGWCNIDV